MPYEDDLEEELDEESYEELYNKYLKENENYIKIFKEELLTSGLTDKTINDHLSKIDFYLNTYLLRVYPNPMPCGTTSLDDFLGNFFIRKCMWSTPSNIKTYAASIKKFYKCMLKHGKIKQNSYNFLCDDIKGNLAEWQANCEMYNDPDSEDSFSMFW